MDKVLVEFCLSERLVFPPRVSTLLVVEARGDGWSARCSNILQSIAEWSSFFVPRLPTSYAAGQRIREVGKPSLVVEPT